MLTQRRIVGSEAFFARQDFSPGLGAISLYRQQNPFAKALAWTRWWHWAGLALALVLVIDARL